MSENTESTENTEKRTICADREKYQKSRTATGKPSLNNGDEVATILAGLTLAQTFVVADSVLDVRKKDLKESYEHLNDGMQRMVLGNRIRAKVKKEDDAMKELKEVAGDFAAKNKVEAEKAEKKKAAEAKAKELAAEKAAKEKAKKDK